MDCLSLDSPEERERCYLLELPLELQFQIYELVVRESKALLLNLPCNSSYRGRYLFMNTERKAWRSGETRPPLQPALTRTCRSIRAETLPLFYGDNVFRACYCAEQHMLSPVINWLKMIGPANREMLRNLYFYDRNEDQDKNLCRALKTLQESEIFSEMGGRMKTMSGDDCCLHLTVFGDWTGREGQLGQMELRTEPGGPRLRIEGEI